MKKIMPRIALFLLLCLVMVGSNCILEEKVIEIVLTSETCVEFTENHDSQNFNTPMTLDYGAEIAEILADNDVSREDIVDATVVSASYEVTQFSHDHDWTVSGTITVERLDTGGSAVTIVDYTSQSIQGALGNRIYAELDPTGVDVLDTALDDFLDGSDPIIEFTVHNGSVDPPPTEQDPIVFVWEACIVMHLIFAEEYEGPDPF
jgi:hypothetical protein